MRKFQKIRFLFKLAVFLMFLAILIGSTFTHDSLISSTGPFPLKGNMATRVNDLCKNLHKSDDSYLQISFKMELASMKLNQNSFQTSNENYGLRMEFDSSGLPALVYMPMEGHLESLSTGTPISLYSETAVNIFWRHNSLLALQVGDQVSTRNTKMYRPLLCDSVRTEVGYDSSRSLEGQIRDFQISIKSTEPIFQISTPLQALLGGIFAFVISSFKKSRRSEVKRGRPQ